MDRRELLQALGASVALAAIPRSAEGVEALISQLNTRLTQQQGFRTLSAPQQALVSRVTDLVFPRTDTPGALDVKVPELIDLLLTEWYDATESQTLMTKIDAIDSAARALGASSFVALAPAAQLNLLRDLDARREEKEGAAAGFRELKSLTVFGYFTSERVTRDILKTRMSFPRYDGNAPVTQ